MAEMPFIVCAQKYKSDKIYWIALDRYTKVIDSLKPSEHKLNDTIFLEKPASVDSVPTQSNGITIVLITKSNQKQLYRSHKNLLTHTVMSAIMVEDSLIHINFIPYSGRLKGRRHYHLSEGEGTTISFMFDCSKRRFIICKINNWGI